MLISLKALNWSIDGIEYVDVAKHLLKVVNNEIEPYGNVSKNGV